MDNFNLQSYIASGKLHADSTILTEDKKQGYDDREDESLGARRGAEKGKKQSMKARRDDSYGKFGKRDAEKKGKNKINKENLSETIAEAKSKIDEGSYPFDQCLSDNEGKYGKKGAAKVCGFIKAQYGEGIVNEMDEVSWNDKNNPTRNKAVGERDPKKVGQSTAAYSINEEIPSTAITKINTKVTNAKTMAQAILDFIKQVQEKESIDYTTNASFKPILAKLNILAKTKDKEEVPLNEDFKITPDMLEKAIKKDPKFEEKMYKAIENHKKGKTNDFRDLMNYLVQFKSMSEVSDKEEIKNIEDTLKKITEDARTDAEQEGYKDGFNDAKDDIEDALKKMKVSELKDKIKTEIISNLSEAEEVDVDIDVEDEVEVDAEADDIEIERKGVKAKVEVGLSPEEEIVQDSLKAAMDAAQALGSDKLADQIGNTITFFTRQFVVGNNTD